MNNNNYINIQGFMINDLKLKGNELILYAIIYGFSQDGQSEYYGSQRYVAKAMGISLVSAHNLINKLLKKELIIKISESHYKTSVKESLTKGVKESLTKGVKESLTNNNNTNNNTSNKGKNTLKWLEVIPLEIKKAFSEKYNCSVSQIEEMAENMILYCGANGKRYKDYNLALQKWLLNSHGLRKKDYLKFNK